MARRRSRTLVIALAGLVLVGAGVMPAGAELRRAGPADRPDRFTAVPLVPRGQVVGAKAPSARLAQTDPELLARTDAEPVQVLLKLDYDATASYTGGVDDLAATSPSVTGVPLTGTTPAERSYARFQREREAAVLGALREAVPSARVGTRLRTVYGGVAATIPADAVERVLAIDGVAAVQVDALHQPLTDSSPEFLGAPPVHRALGGAPTAGAGVLYGNIDTGVWPEHPSLADTGTLEPPPGPARTCDFGDNPQTAAVDPFVCQSKLVGGRAFLDAYLADRERAAAEPFRTARDSNGHGTHTATTSAGNVLADVSVLGVPRGAVQGIAPGAWVMAYKVCGIEGCFASDSAAAVAQAVLDGVDVINYSISGGTAPFTDPVELAFLDAYAAGVVVSASAGNDGPGAATTNHLSPWVVTVAASTQSREFTTTLTLRAPTGATATFPGASLTRGVPQLPVVLASDPPYGDALCQRPAPAGLFEGVLVACRRGTVPRVDKGFNVLQGGAEGMVLFNPALADVETDSHWLPTVHLADGTDLLAFLAAHDDVTGSFPDAVASSGRGDVMAAFSSRGPAGLFLKPDVTAPGVQVLAGDTPVVEGTVSGPPGELFQAIAGTSMSAPHVAGAAILLRALHPGWTAGQIKSALMTTSAEGVLAEDLTTPADPFARGAGRIDIGASAGATLTLDETAARYAALGADAVTAVHLNVPSVHAPVMPGRLETTRVLTNSSDRRVRVRASAEAPPGSRIVVTPDRLSIEPGRSASVTITITSDAPLGAQQFGVVRLTPRSGPALHLPVAFVHTQGQVALSQTCTPGTIVRDGDAATCDVQAVNRSFRAQTVDLSSTVDRTLRITGADGAAVVGSAVRLPGRTLAGARPGVPAVDPGPSPAGYVPLDAFGVTPQPVGDEVLLVVDTPAFAYNGEQHTVLGVTSNGYVVVGGGSVEDLQCCQLPSGPDPARPNNVLAPFWTDLDGSGAPGILVGALTDGPSTWIVVEFRLRVFGTTSPRVFQVWIGASGDATPGQDIAYAYDPANRPADPAGLPFLVGAENVVGGGDMEAVLPTSDLVVRSSDPVPGDVARYRYTVVGDRVGTGVATTEMTADGVPGVTVVRSPVEVRRR